METMDYLKVIGLFMGGFALLYGYKHLIDRICDKMAEKLEERITK